MSKNGILRTLRLEKNFSKKELSNIFNKEFGLDTDEKIISSWESGAETPTGTYLSAYTKIFNISLNYISDLIGAKLETEEIFYQSEKQEEVNIVKRLREELGLSQEELSEKIGYKSKKKIELIEAGLENIPQSKIGKFAKILKTTKEILEKEKNILQEKSVKEMTVKADVVLDSGQEIYFDIINTNKVILHYFKNGEKEKFQFLKMFGDLETNLYNFKIGTIQDITSSIIRGPFGSALKKEFFVQKSLNSYKVYEQKNAIQKNAEIGSYYISYDKYLELKRFECFPNDIIMSCSGTIGKFYQLPQNAEKGVINQALCKFSLNSNVNSIFFLEHMKEIITKLEIKGSGIKNVGSVNYIKALKVLIPPIELQNKFAEFVKQVDKSKVIFEKALKIHNFRLNYFNVL